MRTKSILFTVLVSLVVVTLLASSAGASTITATINPKDNSASVQAKMIVTEEISSNSKIMKTLDSSMRNTSISFNFTSTATVNSNIHAAFNKSVSANSTSAYVQNIAFQYYQNTTVTNTSGETHLFMNTTMMFTMNVTGFIHGRTANMSWRAFNISDNISYSGHLLNMIEFQGHETHRNMLNFHAFAKPLNAWKSVYNGAKNVTTFTYNAGNTIYYNGTFHTPFDSNSITYYNVTMDPTYTIVSPGYSTATNNSLTVGNAPPASTNYVYYYVAAVAVIAVVGGVVYISMRKRR